MAVAEESTSFEWREGRRSDNVEVILRGGEKQIILSE